MKRLKQFSVAAIVALMAVVCVLTGVLAVTVLRPSQEVRAQTTASAPFVTTRDGVFTLIGSSATVTVTSPSGGPVAVALGSVTDVNGWIGSDAYTEIIGVASDRKSLKVEEHPQIPQVQHERRDTAQSDEQESAAEAEKTSESSAESTQSSSSSVEIGQSFDTAQSASILSSDMWLQQASGTGTVSLDIANIGQGKSVIASADGKTTALTVDIVWHIQRTNFLALSAFFIAGVLLLIAIIALIRQLVAQRVPTGTESVALALGMQEQETNAENAHDNEDHEAVPFFAQETAETFKESDHEGSENADEQTSHISEIQNEESSDQKVEETAETSEESVEPFTEKETETSDGISDKEKSEPQGRHAGANADDKPYTRAPSTDTGVIDLSAVRPGAVFPSRRAIREARERGEERLIINGHEFDTGLIPILPQAADKKEEKTEESSWASIMTAWQDRKKRDKRS
ncbi:hypothetical protein [Schaalia sp. lx-260]|uniref:hypothetical protein n=1 Tax=Schaalia sp. lx-260 TaxID=2899082 RepID=UPI001E3C8298|nr:hypothetical protein [Schaalia sp. lx-260]MCD4549637.1 hypothetical protein [Schaalia sp. lx-260]